MEQLADGRYGPWVLVDASPLRLVDGGNPTDFSHTLYASPRQDGLPLSLQLGYARIVNRTGGTIHAGVGVRLPMASWTAGQWTHGTTTYTDDSDDFKSAATGDAPLETTTNGDGFLVQSPHIFNALSILVTTASTGSPTRIAEYSVAGGTWSTLTMVGHLSAGSNYSGSGAENLLLWAPPTNWAPMIAGHGTGVTVGRYGLRVRATAAPTVAGVAASMSVHRIYGIIRNIAVDAAHIIDFGGLYAPLFAEGEALVMCTTVAGAGNMCSALVRSRG